MEKVFGQKKSNNTQSRIKKIKKQKQDFSSSKFRYLNEYLYKNNSQDALEYFNNHQQDFQQYHQGYQTQVEQWPINPLKIKIKKISKISNIKRVIVDHGCGQGLFSKMFYDQKDKKTLVFKKVLSYDLVSTKPFIQQCDISKLPLKNSSVDCSLFSLSLMGTNYYQFIYESLRIIKLNGYILITEVYSRFIDKEKFLENFKKLGCKLICQKNIKDNQNKKLDWKNILKACIYKKRQIIQLIKNF